MRPFELDGGPRVLFGAGRLGELGAEAARLTAGPVLLVSDPGVAAAGHTGRAADSLVAAGIEVVRFDGVRENPTTGQVESGAETARRRGPVQAVVAVGGGSAMDCAKGINFLLSHGGPMEDHEGDGRADRPMLPSIGVPTTAGTGSEAQRFALISRQSDRRKMACGDPGARFRTVILDPDLPLSAPSRIAAAAAIDAVAHAVESFTATNANPASRLYARQAARLLFAAFEDWIAAPAAGSGAGEMLLGAHWAGASIERSMLGAAHACANPLTRAYGISHGVAVGLMLPHVIRFNGAAEGLYAGLLHASGTGTASKAGADAAEALAARVEELLEAAGLPRRLRELRVPEDRLEALAAEAVGQKTARFNPRPVGAAECEGLFAAAYHGGTGPSRRARPGVRPAGPAHRGC